MAKVQDLERAASAAHAAVADLQRRQADLRRQANEASVALQSVVDEGQAVKLMAAATVAGNRATALDRDLAGALDAVLAADEAVKAARIAEASAAVEAQRTATGVALWRAYEAAQTLEAADIARLGILATPHVGSAYAQIVRRLEDAITEAGFGTVHAPFPSGQRVLQPSHEMVRLGAVA